MRSRLRRPHRLALVSSLLVLCLSTIGAAPAGAATNVSKDVYFAAGFERQVDSRTCTAASTAMMMNFIARRDLNLNQMTILRYEQPRDALNNTTQRGSDPLGWSRAATYYSRYTSRPTTYKWEAYGSQALAFRRAATQIAKTSKPVGLLVNHGTHAMVMTGFVATANPATAATWSLVYVWFSDPNGYAHRLLPPQNVPLNTYLETDATSYYDSQWYGKFIVIVPQA